MEESTPRKEIGTQLDSDLVKLLLPTGTIVGRQILVFEETDSTNDLAAQAGDDGLAEGIVIFAESQRAGRGTAGRKWVSPPRQNLLFSVLLRPESIPASRWPELTFCAALAVAEAVEDTTGQMARIKWPNDVLIDGRKVAGILLESHQRKAPGFVVVGVGLNVLQRMEDFDPEIQARAGSLTMAVGPGQKLRRETVAAAVLTKLEELYLRWPVNLEEIMEECERRGIQEDPRSRITFVD